MSILQASPLIPPSRPEIIQSLIDGVDRYNPDNISILEEYLGAQLQNEEYDLMANLAILKLYQFNQHLINDRVIINILVKALTAIPNPDFNLCLYLLHESALAEDSIQKLLHLQSLLEQARYREFWHVYESEETYRILTSEAIGFENAIRKVIARVVAISFQTISTELLQSYLNIGASNGHSDEDFSFFIEKQGWKEENKVVHIPVNNDNEAKPTVIRENIKFEQLTKVIGYSNEL
ncbi:6846_t:CDS:2 [Paraglomus brasilianum]|uniref:Eukaryotic translation initiation factor 3 subunit K n=1 Tax=Paraglomus brasilianum TaxID=144538 RepID=A0A9N9G1R7_9GLOM|nr:6846_t:CDS:2 [Paraglomus brasilianum]